MVKVAAVVGTTVIIGVMVSDSSRNTIRENSNSHNSSTSGNSSCDTVVEAAAVVAIVTVEAALRVGMATAATVGGQQ